MIYTLVTHEKNTPKDGVNPYPSARTAACGWCCGCCYIMFAFFIAGIFQVCPAAFLALRRRAPAGTPWGQGSGGKAPGED